MRWNRDVSPILRCTAIAISLACVSGTLHSQERASRVSFEHDGQGVTGFVLYATPEEGKARIDLGLIPVGERGMGSILLPVLPEGTFALSVAAYSAAGESAPAPASPAYVTVRKVDARAVAAAVKPDVAAPPAKPASSETTCSSRGREAAG